MKKILVMIFMFILPVMVFAAGNVTVSTNNINVRNTKSTSFNLIANNSAGKINISVSDSSIISVSLTGDIWVDNETKSITVKGLKEGTATITITNVDVATYDEEVLTGSYTITVNVTPAVTEEEKKKQEEEKTKAAEEERARQQEEEKKQIEKETLINEATKLVETSENSKLEEDYNNALDKVNALEESDVKTSLLKRLDEVYFQIRLNEEVSKVECVSDSKQCDKVNVSVLYIFIIIICVLESALLTYLVIRDKKKGYL